MENNENRQTLRSRHPSRPHLTNCSIIFNPTTFSLFFISMQSLDWSRRTYHGNNCWFWTAAGIFYIYLELQKLGEFCWRFIPEHSSELWRSHKWHRGVQNPWEEAFFRFFVSSRHVPANSSKAIDQLDSRARGQMQWRMATLHVGVGLCFTCRGHKLSARYSIHAPPFKPA